VRVFETVLVALADHGFTPTAIAARLTYLSAPDSLQGALAAGLLGGGSRFLGVTEDAGRFLAGTLAGAGARRLPTTTGWDALALEAVGRPGRRPVRPRPRASRAQGHRPAHPRAHPDRRGGGPARPAPAPVRGDRPGPPQVLGRTLPLNGAGTCGAALADLGLPIDLLRGFALLARAAGLLGHLAEEQRHPIAMDIYLGVDRNATYVPPDTSA
jgi:citrate synthase